MNVSEFLIERLENAGVKHVFGVPGDYVLDFYSSLCESEKIKIINTCDEAGAGFAADAYSRIAGIGCVCVTYNVGALKIANSVACAYAERSPMIVISGSPGIKERQEGMLLHHMVRSFESQREVFEKWTCATAVLENPYTAGYEIDRVLEAMKHHKQPVYIEIPRDIAKKPLKYDVSLGYPNSPKTELENLSDAIQEVKDWIFRAENPVILAGVQLARYGLGKKLIKFAEKNNIPVATTLLSKSVVNENDSLAVGVYMGDASQENVKKLVDDSDCLLMLGVLRTDMTLCFKPSTFPKKQVVDITVEGLKIKSHNYHNVQFKDFCEAMFNDETVWTNSSQRDKLFGKNTKIEKFVPEQDVKIKAERFFEKINSMLTSQMAIVADIGDSLFGAADLTVHHNNHFLSPAFYTTMGFAIPGALGLQLAKPEARPIVLVGDGAFQMSCVEISTMAKLGLNPIIFILNNDGYTTERLLKEGKFNDIASWDYEKVASGFGAFVTTVVTEKDLEDSINVAMDKKIPCVINVKTSRLDASPALMRMTKALAKRV